MFYLEGQFSTVRIIPYKSILCITENFLLLFRIFIRMRVPNEDLDI